MDKEGAPRHLFIEFFGTMIITLITSGAVLSTGALNVKYDLEEVRPGRIFGIAFANAAVFIALLASVSGLKRTQPSSKIQIKLMKYKVGHFNPATSLACAFLGQIEYNTAMYYSLVQLVGGITGSLILWMSWFAISPVPTLLGANLPNPDTRWWEGLFVEIVMSFSFHWVLLKLYTREKEEKVPYHSARILLYDEGSESNAFFAGTALLISNIICIAVSGGSMNPARSFGPAVVAGVWKYHWMYWLGPYFGALFAAYYLQLVKEKKKEEDD